MTAPDATPARGDEYTEAEVNAMVAAVERVLHRHLNEPDALVTEDDGLTCAHVWMMTSGINHALDAVTRPACSGCGERFAEGDEICAHIATCEKHPMSALAAERDALAAQKDAAYEERNRCVAYMARLSLALGYRVMVTRTAIEGWSEDWHGCVYIDTPNGQASWHFHDSHAHLFADLPHGAMEWDGHTTEEKYARLHESRPENALAARVRVLEGVSLLTIPAQPGLDPVRVVMIDHELGKGTLIVQCCDQAWTAYFGAMGKRTLLQFVASVGRDYLGSAFRVGNETYRERVANAVILAARDAARTAEKP